MYVSSLLKYLRGVRGDLSHISWPSRDDVTKSFMMLVVVVLFFVCYFALSDFCANKLINFVLGL